MKRLVLEVMMKNARRMVAILLLFSMILSFIPLAAIPFASAEGGSDAAVSGSDAVIAEETEENTSSNDLLDVEKTIVSEVDVAETDDLLAGVTVVSSTDAEEASIEEEVTSDSDTEDISVTHPKYSESVIVDGVKVSISAPAGVFPAGAELNVTKVSDATQSKVDALIEGEADDSFTFDIKIMMNGEEIQPDTAYGEVSVRFDLDVPANAEVEVYHIDDALTDAEAMPSVVNGDAVSVVTDSFSLFTVEFTYNTYTYTLDGNDTVMLSEILTTLGLSGGVTAAASSDESLFTVTQSGDDWVIESLKTFATEESLSITLEGTQIDIVVTCSLSYTFFGDLNKDGVTDQDDLDIANEYRLDLRDFSDEEIFLFDLDADGDVDEMDIFEGNSYRLNLDPLAVVPYWEAADLLVEVQPVLTGYSINDTFSADGLVLSVTYSNGTKHTIGSGYTVPATVFTHGGRNAVYATYGDKKSEPMYVYIQYPEPTGLNAVVNRDTPCVELTWSAVDNAEYYSVYRSDSATGSYTCIASNITDAQYVDTSALRGETYYYKVVADSLYSECVSPLSEYAEASGWYDDCVASGTCGGCIWYIDAENVLHIEPANGVRGTLNDIYEKPAYGRGWGWHDYRAEISKVVVDSGVYGNRSVSYIFYELKNCTEMDLSGLDTSKVRDMQGMFSRCEKLTKLDVSGFDTSSVTDMSDMFTRCEKLTKLDVSGFDTSSVTDMGYMFWNCKGLTELDVGGFDTSSVTDMYGMFYNCNKLKKLDVSGFDTSSVTDMGYMFDDCDGLTELDVSGFDTSSVKNMRSMFDNCKSLTELDVSGFDTSSVKDMRAMFRYCKGLTELDVSSFDTSSVTNMESMFADIDLTELDVSSFDTSSVTDMSGMFSWSNLTKLDLSGFDTSSVTDMSSMFGFCGDLIKLDISGFDTSSVTDMSSMFASCVDLTELNVGTGWVPASGYSGSSIVNYFNVVNGSLEYLPATGDVVYSVTIHDNGTDIPVDLESYPDSYPGFTGDKTATIVFGKAYTVTWKNANGIVLETDNNVAYGTTPSYDGATPTKAADAQYTYIFAGWSPAISAVTGDATYTATYSETTNSYKITFVDEDGTTVLDEQTVAYGETPVYGGETPTKAADAQYSYEFTGWDPEVVAVVGDATYTAQFSSTTNSYNVTWLVDGEIYETKNVQYGSDVPTVDDPTKPATAEFTYTFNKWQDLENKLSAEGKVVQDVTLTALFDSDTNSYTITFVDEDGTTVLEEQKVKYGETPVYGGETPTKAADAQYTYEFAGWTPAISEVTGDATYTAQFDDITNEYTITFVDEDGTTVLDEQTVAYGETPVYGGETPTKAADAQCTYEFAGWTPAISEVTGDATYTATYSETTNSYKITFVDEDGTTVLDEQTVAYGETPVYGGETPTKASDAQYTYTFAGWSPAISAVTGDATYTATYSETTNSYKITFVDEDGTTVLDEQTVAYGETPVYGGETPTKASDAQYTYTFAGWSPTVSEVTGDVIYTATYSSAVNKYTVTWKNADGTVLETDNNVAYGTTPSYDGATPTKAATAQYTYTFAGWSPAVSKVTGNATYTATYTSTVNKYTVAFDENGGSEVEDLDIEYGFTVDEIPETTKEGYTFDGWFDEDGNELTEDTVITGDVTYTAQWTANQFTVTFVDSISDAVIGDPVTVDYNTAATAPTVPTHDGFSFVLWATEKNGETVADFSAVTADMTVWAVYGKAPIRDPITGTPYVTFDKTSKSFEINEAIKFEAVGFWADSTVTELVDGDERYIPLKWHHAEPSGDFGGKTAPTDNYTGSFKQSKAGTYTLKVDFTKYVYENGAWVDKGIVTVETQYKVVAPSGGSSDVPNTGDHDNTANVVLAINLMFLSGLSIVLYYQYHRREKNNAA